MRGLPGHTAILHLTFWGIAKLFSKMASLVYIPTSNVREFLFLHILVNTVIACLFDYSHPVVCEVVSQWDFDLRFLNVYLMMFNNFLCASSSLIFFGEICIQILCPFLVIAYFYFWVVKILYMFWIQVS